MWRSTQSSPAMSLLWAVMVDISQCNPIKHTLYVDLSNFSIFNQTVLQSDIYSTLVSNAFQSSFIVNGLLRMDMHIMFTSFVVTFLCPGTLTITPAPPSLSSAPPWRTTLTKVDPLCWMSQCRHCRQSGTLPEQPSWGLLSAVHRTCTGTCSSTTSEQMFTEHSFVQSMH